MQLLGQGVQIDSNGHPNARDGRNRSFGKDPENKSLQDSRTYILHRIRCPPIVPSCRHEGSVYQASRLCQAKTDS